MSLLEILRQVRRHLEETGRVSFRMLRREFELDDDALEELIEELVEIQGVALREASALAWAGGAQPPAASIESPASAQRDPRSYTPNHLAERILTTRAALEGERKQVTVLFADVKGSVELAEGVDPEEWHRILDRFFQILADGVHRFEGTVNQYTGDGIMALFGAPIAHEDHAQRACYSALHLQRGLEDYARQLKRERGLIFSARMGLNSGEVVVGKIGDDLRMDYTAQGQVVNLAARMEQLAGPGKIYLSGACARLVHGLFQLEDLGAFQVHGVHEPLPVFELQGVGEHRTRLEVARARGFTRFVGRDPEMRMLESALERAVEGIPQVVGLVAEAGTGKSRLTFEFTERCRARGIPVSTGHGVSHGRSIPLLPLLEELRSSFGISERDDPRRVRQKIAGALVLLDRELEESAPLIFDLFGVPDPQRPVPPLLPEQRQSRVFAVLRRALHARSRQAAAVTLLEDLHWFDPTSVVFLGSLIEAIQGTRSLLLLTFRPEFQAEWMERSEYQQLSLQPLGRDAVGELLGDLLGHDPSLKGLGARIFDVTGGNPFFVEEVVQELAESGRLEGAKGSYRLREPVDAIAVPGSVQALLAARIDRLPERDKQLLQTAAVIGKEFSEPLVRRVSELPDLELNEALHQLRSGELVYQAELYPESVWAFKHSLTREVAYRSQLGERRRRLHASVARGLEEGDATGSERSFALLAHHWEEAGARLEAARAHMRAARQVILDDFEEPIWRWQRVCELLAELPESPETIGMELRARLWLLYMAWPTGRSHQEMRGVFTRARELAPQTGNEESLVELQTHFGRLLRVGGEVEEGAELIRDAHRRAEGIESPRIRGEVVTALADLLTDLGRCEESLAEVRRALAVLSPAATVTTRANLRYCEANALLWLGRPREGLRVAEEALAMALRDVDPRAQSFLTWLMSGIAELTGEWGLALDRTREQVELVERHGGAATMALAHLSHGRACLLAGELDRAESALTRALELSHYPRLPTPVTSLALLHLSRLRLAGGDLAEAERLASEAATEARGLGQLGPEAWTRIQLARVILATGEASRAPEAREALDSAAEILQRTDLGCLEPLLHLGRAELAGLTGDGEARRRELSSALRIYRDWGNRREVERITREMEL